MLYKLCMLLGLAALSLSAAAQPVATLIVHNAKIVTLDDAAPTAQAVAIANDRIIAVGSNDAILKQRSSTTQVVDAKGQTVIPGLYDSHLHVIRAGRSYNQETRWDGVKTLSRALTLLKEQAARTPKGQWVRVVGGWNEYQFAEKRLPTLEEINDATGNVPTFILYLYGMAYLNKAGLAALSITDTSKAPEGGQIQKDRSGQPTGMLIANPNAMILYSTLAKLPKLSAAEQFNSTKQFVAELNRLGLTSAMDAGGGFQAYPDDYSITDSLSKLGQLNIRIPYYLFAQKPGKELQDYQKWVSMIDIDHQPGEEQPVEYFVEGGGESLVIAGGDFENFLKPRPELSLAMDKQLKDVLTVLIKNRWPFRLHATYNESISRFLNVIEAVNKQYPIKGLPWLFDHAETVSEENLKRIKALDGGISIQNRMAFQGEAFVKRYGKTPALNAPPIRRMLTMKIKVGAGTDGTRVSTYNPWISLYWLVTGKTVGGMQHAADSNKLDRTTALKLFTQGSASLVNQDKELGKIKVGMLADLAILSADYLTVDAEEIKNITAHLTVLNGKVVYASGAYGAMAPPSEKAIPEWSPVNFYGGYQAK